MSECLHTWGWGMLAAATALAATIDASAGEVALKVGVASIDITPEPGLRMWGYSSRTTPATGTAEPLSARALVLESRAMRVAVVTLDLGRTPEEALLDRLRASTVERCGIDRLLVTASHTHQAPSLESYDGQENAYAAAVTDQLAGLVAQAADELVPVTLSVATTTVDVSHNRRRYLADGRVAMQWRNEERTPTRAVDPKVTVIRFDREDGAPLAVMFHYTCHPVVLGPDNLEYSPDFVGAARETIDAALNTTSLYLQGAAGDINPYLDKTPVASGGLEACRAVGVEVGSAVVAAAEKAQTIAPADTVLRFEQRVVPVALRWDIQQPEVREVLSHAYGARFDRYLARQLSEGTVPAVLSTMVLGDAVALVGMPGEIFVDFQFMLREQAPYEHALLVGYSNGYHAYFPTIRDAALGGYGGKTATYVAVGSGERLTNEALISLYRLAGALGDAPLLQDFRLIEWDKLSDEQRRAAQ